MSSGNKTTTIMNKQEKLNEILENATNMVLSGTLLKNVKKHFTNLGVSSELADKIVRIAELSANEFQFLSAK